MLSFIVYLLFFLFFLSLFFLLNYYFKIFFIFPRKTYKRNEILNLVEILKTEYYNLLANKLSYYLCYFFFGFSFFFVYFWTKIGGIGTGSYWKGEIENYFFHSFLFVAALLLLFNLLEEKPKTYNSFVKYILEEKKTIFLSVSIGLISCNFSTYVIYREFSIFFVLFHFLLLFSVLIMFFNGIFFISKKQEEDLDWEEEV